SFIRDLTMFDLKSPKFIERDSCAPPLTRTSADGRSRIYPYISISLFVKLNCFSLYCINR
ncbi:hypothetical protein L9F63_016223, partial [Diploptera punctata]